MKKNKETCSKKCSIGGQALIEGIMMRGPKKIAMAVRNPQGEIVLEEWKTPSGGKSGIKKLPLVRGVFGFISSMKLGYKSLMRSAEIYGLEEAEEELKKEKAAKKAAKAAAKKAKKVGSDAEEVVTAEVTEETAEAVVEDTETVASPELETTTDETPEANTEKAGEDAEKKIKEEKSEKKESSVFSSAVMVVSVIFALIIFVGLFMLLPSAIYDWLAPINPVYNIQNETQRVIIDSAVKSAFEGVMRIILLVSYMLIVSLMKDIRRTFMYHGAEHKTIFCYEHGHELTVENVRRERRFHPRCGTSFLILMVLVSICISFFIDPLLVLILGPHVLDGFKYLLLRTAIKLILVAPIMGIGYELIKFAGKHDNFVTKIISAPGVWLQHITVLEPTDDMIECAIMAFNAVLPESEKACDIAEDTETGPDISDINTTTEATEASEAEEPVATAEPEVEEPIADESIDEAPAKTEKAE